MIFELATQADHHDLNEQVTLEQALHTVGASDFYQKRAFVIFGFQWFFVKYACNINPLVGYYFLQFFYLEIQKLIARKIQFVSSIVQTHQAKNVRNLFAKKASEDNYKFSSSPFATTAFGENLNCQENLLSLIKSSVYVGSLFGLMVFSFVSDNYGRRTSLIFSWLFTSLGSLLIGLSSNFIMIAIGLFLAGFGANPTITFHYPLINEHTLGDFREIQNVGLQIFFAIGEFGIITVAFFFQDWKILTLFWLAIPTLLINLGQLFIYESPKYLYQKNKVKCVNVLNQIASVNNRPFINIDQLEDNPMKREQLTKIYSLIDLFKYHSTRYMTIAGFFLLFTIQLIYYGISFVCDEIGFSFYVNMYIVASFELVAYISIDFLIVRLRRKKAISTGFLLIGLMSTFFLIQSDSLAIKIIQGLIAGIMRFSVCIVLSMMYVYISETFPTVVRSLALGFLSVGGNVGSILQTFLIKWSYAINIHPMFTFGMFGLISVFLMIPMKETLHQVLPNKIEEDDFLFGLNSIKHKIYIRSEQISEIFEYWENEFSQLCI